MAHDWIRIDRLRAHGVVGLHEWERERKQEIWIDAHLGLDLRAMGASDRVETGVNYGTVAADLLTHAESAERFTLEALATDLAGVCLHHAGVSVARVVVSKPAADPHARRISVDLVRTRPELERRAFIGLGSNASPERMLPEAVRRLAAVGPLVALSRAYENPGVGEERDRVYVNAAVCVRTCLPPGAVRRALKEIERGMGRDPSVGAQVPIDLDLCLLDGLIVRTGGVSIPDPDILVRAYLARTLAEIDAQHAHPETGEPLGVIADRLVSGAGQPSRVREDIRLTSTLVQQDGRVAHG